MQSRLHVRLLATALVLGCAIATPLSASAAAPCTRWDLSQGWYAIQNNGWNTEFQLQQRGDRVSGTGSTSGKYSGNRFESFAPNENGPVAGSAVAGAVEIRTTWGGVYIGTIDETGRIDGTTYDMRNATQSSTWYSDRRMNCLSRAEAPVMGDRVSAGGTVLPSRTKSASVFGERPSRTPAPAPAPAPAPIPVSTTPDRVGTVCKTGFVHRLANAADRVCVTPASHQRVVAENRKARSRIQPGGGFYGPNTCRNGFVWREAFVGDLVCVEPGVRTLVRQENTYAARLLTTRERG